MDKKTKNIFLASGGVLTAGAITATILLIRRRNRKRKGLLRDNSKGMLPQNTLPQGFRNWNGGTNFLTDAPRGIRNNNPGNLKLTNIKWNGKFPNEQNTDRTFEMFLTPEYGIRAMIKDLKHDIDKGKKTVPQLITEYAPPSENDTEAYIDKVCKDLKVSRTAQLLATRNTLLLLVKSISRIENGGNYISAELFDKAYAMI